MIVADSECRPELQGYLPFSRGGGGGGGSSSSSSSSPGAGEEQRMRWARGGPRGPSAFIPVEEDESGTHPLLTFAWQVLQEGAESLEQNLGLEALMSCGRVDNLAVVMGLHPDYLSRFWRLHYLLLHTDGPLASSWRHYIAIMAAARHQCSYLVGSHMAEFLQTGGDPEWLLGLHRAPEKLRKLNEINKLLAHRPWLITKEHIQSFEAARDVEALLERMRQLQESLLRDEGASQEEMESRFELEKSESLLVTPSADILESSPHPDMLCFVEDPTFGYEDFTRRGTQAPPTFRAQDYTWEDHGYSLIQRLYPEGGQLLDEKFQAAYSLTYNTMAMHSGVDTSMLRRAIWNYIHCVFGIRYDDYDYGEVNQLLERNLKVYIKTVACYPEKTTRRMYRLFWRHFRHSEKVHVNLLLLEARMQAALLYALRAITRYMT
ncbi:sestrin-2 isoform X6 [Pipistrellus kuhlii]|uniref:sestrin-2 isoform X6 n=1 Tax=Pipistrellus kuhlii TaxID=59472 RepID=UPI00174EF5E3|nr:sestrin-2 isoform X6 [Pipistrellus kuhlii]